MYKICVIGSGYVGLVAGACFASSGNKVVNIDVDKSKIDALNNGKVPIFEPGLDKLIEKNIVEKRQFFSTEISDSIAQANICFIAVGTPPGEDGSADLQYVLAAASSVGKTISKYTVIVDKSTVPVGTADKVKNAIQKELDIRAINVEFDVVSNPEFLREGNALGDFMEPDRVVIGTESDKAGKIMTKLYQPFLQNDAYMMIMDTRSAELTKYAANAMLALRISYMNEISNLCETLGANVDNVRRGIGSDFRIGKHFLYSGIGYGGSCFPKDVKAIIKTASENNYNFKILNAVEEVNAQQKEKMFHKMNTFFKNNLKGKQIAVWGLSFKPDTDDMREAPSIVLITALLNAGAKVVAFDPEAMDESKHIFGDKIKLVNHMYDCLPESDALLICTEWNDFRNPDYEKLSTELKAKAIFDGRNICDLETIENFGFNYFSIGRKDIIK
jgi:UDPglucose 6-dehydrogenase